MHSYLEFVFRKRLAGLWYNLYDVPNVQLKVTNDIHTIVMICHTVRNT